MRVAFGGYTINMAPNAILIEGAVCVGAHLVMGARVFELIGVGPDSRHG